MPVGRNVLELNGVRESANYTCVAMSSLGIIEAVAQVIVKCKERVFLIHNRDFFMMHTEWEENQTSGINDEKRIENLNNQFII